MMDARLKQDMEIFHLSLVSLLAYASKSGQGPRVTHVK